MIKNSNNFLENYYKECIEGKYIICHTLKKELDRLMNDLSSKDYVYDTTSADLRINFIENVVRLTKSPFYGKPMKLLSFQKAFISALYGFKMLDGTDRFQRALFLLSRKNGKSEVCSALILTELIIGGTGLDIVCSSNDDNQADILYQAVDTMRLMIDPNQVDTWRNQKGIRCLLNDNKIFKLSSRTKNREGRNIDVSVIDEIHEMAEPLIIKAIEQSQSLKINPKLILITTAGFVNNGALDNEMLRARGIINEEIEDRASDRYLPWIYEQDSEQEVWEGNRDNRLWEKANPSLGVVKRYEYLEQQVDLARSSKADRVFVMCKDFNIKQSTNEAWLRQEDYDYNATFDIETIRGTLCVGGVDIAETTDLSAAFIVVPKNKKKYVLSQYFIPSEKLNKKKDEGAGAKYGEWIQKGYIRLCEGNYIDTSIIADWFYELHEKYGLRPYCVGYDARFANEFINKANDYGMSTANIWQRPDIMNLPLKMVESDLQSRNIVGLNEVDKWCIGNATLVVNSRGDGLLDHIKGLSSRKIDGAAALAIAYEVYRREKQYLGGNDESD